MKKFLLPIVILFLFIFSAKADLLDHVQWARLTWQGDVNERNHDISLFDVNNQMIYPQSYFCFDTVNSLKGYAAQISTFDYEGNMIRSSLVKILDPDNECNAFVFEDMRSDASNNVIYCGYFNDTVLIDNSFELQTDRYYIKRFIAKYNDKGECLWAKTINENNNQMLKLKGIPSAICTDNKNNIYYMSYYYDTLRVGNYVFPGRKNYGDICVVKFDSNGVCQWARKVFVNSMKLLNGDVYQALSLDLDNNYLYFIASDFMSIVSDSLKEYDSPYDRGFGIVQLDAKDGSLIDVYHIGSQDDYKPTFPMNISGKVINNKAYIIGNFSGSTTIGKEKLVSGTNHFLNRDGNSFLLQYDLDKKSVQWLNQIKSDSGTVLVWPFYWGACHNLAVKDKLYMLLYSFNGSILLNDCVYLPQRNDLITAIAVCDTNGRWQDCHMVTNSSVERDGFLFSLGDNWMPIGYNIDKSGNYYFYGIFWDSVVHINDKITIEYKAPPLPDFLGHPAHRLLLKADNVCSGAAFSYPNPDYEEDFNILQSAALDCSELILTPSRSGIRGAAWRKEKTTVGNGFSTSFTFRMQAGWNSFEDGSLPGADGFAFVIQNAGPGAIGKTGGGIGYASIPNSIAIEFDTYRDYVEIDSISDPNGNHIAVFSSGTGLNSSNHKSPACLGTQCNIPTLRADGTLYYSKIEYDAINKKLYVYIDSTEKYKSPALVLDNFDISKILDIPDRKAFVGFTSATGTSFETHEILSWDYCQSNSETPNPVAEYRPNSSGEPSLISYPNPFSNETNINFYINETGFVDISVYDIYGNKVSRVYSGELEAGDHTTTFKADQLAEGNYYCQMKFKTRVIYSNMILIK